MAHVRKTVHVFECDGCGCILAQDEDERQALREARQQAAARGWRWFHPGYGLRCPNCQDDRRR